MMSVSLGGQVADLRFADDINLMDASPEAAKEHGMAIGTEKSLSV